MLTRAATAAALALLVPAIAATPAGATGSYPGETLSIAQSGPAVVGQAVNFVASGQQADVNSYAGGFGLEVFQKDPAVDATCAPSYTGEKNTYASEIPSERYIVVSQWQGADTSFNVPFKAVPDKAGPMLLCAYSSWIVDTAAAAAPLTVNVAPAGGGSTSGNGGGNTGGGNTTGNAGPVRPANAKKPTVKRSGKKLTCNPGTWSNSPTGYAYSWLVNGKSKKGARGKTLGIGRSLKGRKVQCGVTATNTAGAATALSSPYRVH